MLTKDKLQAVHSDLQKALEQVAKQHGLTLGRGTRISFTENTFKFTAEFTDNASSPTGAAIDPKFLNNMKRYGFDFGLSEADIGKKLTYPGLGEVELLGMSGRIKTAVKDLKSGKIYVTNAAIVGERLSK